jgi:large subunit ribosomal protein L21
VNRRRIGCGACRRSRCPRLDGILGVQNAWRIGPCLSNAPSGLQGVFRSVRMFAVIKVGGKQYRTVKDEELIVDRLPGEVGEALEMPVAFVAGEDDFDLNERTAKVEILEHLKGKKIHVYKYKPKKNSRKKTGHRQAQTRIRVLEV